MPFSSPHADWLPQLCSSRIAWVIRGRDLTRPCCFCLESLWQRPRFKANVSSLQPTDEKSGFSALAFCCRLGEVTLKDFKAAIDREGNHRYHFKALDPEFGTVKEEVQNARGVWVVYW